MTERISTRQTSIRALDQIDAGRAVRGIQHVDLANLVNWTLGRGAQLIAGHYAGSALTSGTQYRLSYRVQPRYQAIQRLWSVDAITTDSVADVTLSVIINGGSAVVVPVPKNVSLAAGDDIDWNYPSLIGETLGSQSSAEATVTVDVTPTNGDAILRSVSCFEVPRPIMSNSTDEDGTEAIPFNPSNPALKSTFTNILDVIGDSTKIGRRCSLAHWAVPHGTGTPPTTPTTAFATAITSTSYVDLKTLYLPVLDRKLGRTATTATATVKLIAWVTGGTGDFQVITTAGTSAGVSISATTPTVTSGESITVHCEDLASTDGRQTAATPAWDVMQIQCRKNVSGTLYVAGYSVIGV